MSLLYSLFFAIKVTKGRPKHISWDLFGFRHCLLRLHRRRCRSSLSFDMCTADRSVRAIKICMQAEHTSKPHSYFVIASASPVLCSDIIIIIFCHILFFIRSHRQAHLVSQTTFIANSTHRHFAILSVFQMKICRKCILTTRFDIECVRAVWTRSMPSFVFRIFDSPKLRDYLFIDWRGKMASTEKYFSTTERDLCT